jgi:hypothetical protein
MLNNLTNFFNLIVGKRIKTQLEDSDLIAIGTKQSKSLGDYKPTAIQFKDLKTQLGGGGGSTPVDIVYSNLYNKIINSELIPGTIYRLTDYKSVNFLNGWEIANNNPLPIDPSFNPIQIHTGDNEVLILEAISDYQLNPVGNSETYGRDIIEFQGYTNKIGVNFDIYNGQSLPDSSVVSGFDLQWDGTNVYFDMPTGYPALFGHYFYLYAEFEETVLVSEGYPYTISTSGVASAGDDDFDVFPLGGSGTGIGFNIEKSGGAYTFVMVKPSAPGTGYQVGDTFLILGSELGGVDGVNDLTIEILTLTQNYSTTSYYQDGNFEPLTPVIAECQYPYTNTTDYLKPMSRLSVSADGMKVILLDLVQSDVTNYIADTLYVQTVYAIGDAYGWITKRNDTERNISVPFDFRSRIYRRYEVDLTPVNASLGIGYYSIGDDSYFYPYGNILTTGLYKDYLSFGNDGQDTYNIEWNDMGGADRNWYAGFNDNVVCLGVFSNNTIGSFFSGNTIENGFSNNTIGNSFSINIIKDGFSNNTIGNSFSINIIGDSFAFNTIENSFYYNTIGYGFQYNIINGMVSNSIGNYFQRNKIMDGFAYCTIQDFFSGNVITQLFTSNTIVNNFQQNIIETQLASSINFSTATHVYGDYNCTIFKRSNGTLQLSYVNGTNIVQYTAITA